MPCGVLGLYFWVSRKLLKGSKDYQSTVLKKSLQLLHGLEGARWRQGDLLDSCCNNLGRKRVLERLRGWSGSGSKMEFSE